MCTPVVPPGSVVVFGCPGREMEHWARGGTTAGGGHDRQEILPSFPLKCRSPATCTVVLIFVLHGMVESLTFSIFLFVPHYCTSQPEAPCFSSGLTPHRAQSSQRTRSSSRRCRARRRRRGGSGSPLVPFQLRSPGSPGVGLSALHMSRRSIRSGPSQGPSIDQRRQFAGMQGRYDHRWPVTARTRVADWRGWQFLGAWPSALQ